MLEPAPPWLGLLQEVQTPSLFASERLLLVPEAGTYLNSGAPGLERLPESAAAPVWVGLFALRDDPPGSNWASLPWVEARHLPLPPPPKPWEEVLLSREQRQLLLQVLAEDAPEILPHSEVVEALLDAHGFSPRQLVQAARGLLASGELTAQQARHTAGRESLPASQLDRALQAGDGLALASSLAKLAWGASLEDFRGELASGRRAAELVGGVLARACWLALAVRLMAEEAGLAQELAPKKVAEPSWYPRVFKPRLYPALIKAAEGRPEMGLAERSAWALQAAFRVAARFPAQTLVAALAALVRFGGLRASGAEPWSPLLLAYASLFQASRSW